QMGSQDAASVAKAERIRQLNDVFRRTFVGGAVIITPGIEQLALPLRAELLRLVREFDRFEPGNDPHGEHDFGSFELGEQKIFWKIDYYDREVVCGSDDPADPTKTTRILTVMLAGEY